MKQGIVYYQDIKAGLISETDDGIYTFKYDNDYVLNYPNQFITFTMPVNNTIYTDKILFPFFEGLIPEGWLLDVASHYWKLNKNDRMTLLLTCCQNSIGAVSVKPIENSNG